MSAQDVMTITGVGLGVFLMVGAVLTDRKVKRLEREIAADEAAREAAGHAAE